VTAYTNFTSDFPKRCLDILDMALPMALEKERDITLLLMAASAGFLVPFERLKSSHPFRFNEQETRTISRLSELKQRAFVGSVLCPDTSHSWELAEYVSSVEGDLEGWLPSVNLELFGGGRKVEATLDLIRNALAHGNIHTIGSPIQNLIFVTEIRGVRKRKGQPVEYDVLRVSQIDFNRFVRNWINFLQVTDPTPEVRS
jgi:hypothetical protein